MVVLLNITRKLVTTSCLMTRFGKRANPGLNYQINAIEDAADAIQRDPEGFGDLESNLFNAHLSHREHELDLKRQKEQIRHRIVTNKYFKKDPLPNLLTYAEKEQIKFLHSNDEEEWTVEKLAESFPASAEIICKILKANWSPMSAKRISIHDANVIKNWERFKNEEYKEQMSPELIEHIKRFIDRREKGKISQNGTVAIQKKQWKKPISNEFSSIISSLRKKNTDTKESGTLLVREPKSKETKVASLEGETYLLGDIKKKKPITIDQLKGSMIRNESKNLDQWTEQKNVNVSGTEGHKADSSSYLNNVTNYTEKFISNEVVIGESGRKRYEMSETKQRVYIPRKLRRKGATYRANDCYYDDDGEFLYKVPGMGPP